MKKDLLISLFFLALLLFVLYQVLVILSPFLQPLFWAAILAFAFYPIYQKFKKVLKDSRNRAAGLTTAIIFLAFMPLVLFIVLSLAGESIRLYQWVSAAIRENRLEAWIDRLHTVPLIKKLEAFF